MNCANCYTIYSSNNKLPACLSGKCPIVDIAGNKRLNKLVDGFIQIEILAMSTGYESFQEKIINESGLYHESPDTILEMKSILAEYREWAAKKGGKGKK